MNPLADILADPEISGLLTQAQSVIAAVHRRPVNLRRVEVTTSEAALRGARSAARMWGLPEEHTIAAYALLAPEVAHSTIRTFRRAPLQVFARLDVLLGGAGVPNHPERLSTLAQLIVRNSLHPGLMPGIIHGELVAREALGKRSGVAGWASARIAAQMEWDPRGLCVPEPYWYRHSTEYFQAIKEYPNDPKPLLKIHLRGWIAGAEEAEGIARAAVESPRTNPARK
ncbi:hypothetical protein [Corynebacterium freiburgense]|uniref:hypothetical protein n=1 Tax=Corynebacterium freiburgense TaxID=556548 RepID=UPI000550292D|nr:hypothetical protein [Corynebacterium freiburgense]WJZ01477.1 hypothetical protein CFREI_00840 [Corynebacterium freiburgense]